jgi:pyruvate/2-oxoglutarate dehydrogenase complex dihydrolipoamide dehydrogenase (E3) component
MEHDLIVVGGGPGGMAAARAAARAGARPLLVQRGPIGGDCTFIGCVPSKALIEAAARGEPFTDAMAIVRRAVGTIAATEGDDVFRREGVEVGRRGATAGLGLESAGVETERGLVKVDRHLATTAPGMWAVGDVNGLLPFTHAADEMGRIAAANALSRWPRHSFDPSAIPWVIFISPEVGRVGLTEAEEAEHRARVAYLPMTEVDRAIVAGETRGFVKLIAGPRRILGNAGGGRLVGATVVASRGGELVHEPALAMRTGMFAGRLAQAVHAYPTWSIALRQAAAQLFMEIDGRTARPAWPEVPGS